MILFLISANGIHLRNAGHRAQLPQFGDRQAAGVDPARGRPDRPGTRPDLRRLRTLADETRWIQWNQHHRSMSPSATTHSRGSREKFSFGCIQMIGGAAQRAKLVGHAPELLEVRIRRIVATLVDDARGRREARERVDVRVVGRRSDAELRLDRGPRGQRIGRRGGMTWRSDCPMRCRVEAGFVLGLARALVYNARRPARVSPGGSTGRASTPNNRGTR